MLVLSSPSGAGKTTLSRMLLKADQSVELSVSVTTRPRRAGEKRRPRLSLHRRSRSSSRWSKNGELLELAEVFGNFYGTPRAPVETRAGRGARRAVRHRLAGHAATAREGRATIWSAIFVLPPSTPELEQRLRTRAQDRRRDRVAHGEGRRRDEPLGRVRLRHRQRRHRPGVRARCARSSPPSGSSANGRPACPISSALASEALIALA